MKKGALEAARKIFRGVVWKFEDGENVCRVFMMTTTMTHRVVISVLFGNQVDSI